MFASVPTPPGQELLGAIVASSSDAIVSKTLDGIITSWNESAGLIFGYTAKEAVGQPITMILPHDRSEEEQNILEQIRKGRQISHFETKRRRKNGDIIDVSVTISPIRAKDGTIIGASKVARDITEQKRLSHAANLLAAIVSSSDDAIISKNLQGVVLSWNTAAERIYGYSAHEMLGKPVQILLPADRKNEDTEILKRISEGTRFEHYETLRQRKNGEIFPVSLTISPIKDSFGKIVGASKIARDITDIRRISAEREQLLISEQAARTEAELANKLKDDFLVTISHELRTPLNAILGWTQVLKEIGSSGDVQEGLQSIERNALSQAGLIEDLLDSARISSGKLILDLCITELQGLIRDAVDTVRHAAAAKNIAISTTTREIGGVVLADKERLTQVFSNLLGNAIKFTPSGGRVRIRTKDLGACIEIAVEDDGVGISAKLLPHIFERFIQADPGANKRAGGLGIGLALVRQLVELHSGTVRAESPGLGKGTTFTVSLPAARSVYNERSQ